MSRGSRVKKCDPLSSLVYPEIYSGEGTSWLVPHGAENPSDASTAGACAALGVVTASTWLLLLQSKHVSVGGRLPGGGTDLHTPAGRPLCSPSTGD